MLVLVNPQVINGSKIVSLLDCFYRHFGFCDCHQCSAQSFDFS